MKIDQVGVACHTGEYSCFHNSLTGADGTAPASSHVLEEVFEVIEGRKAQPVAGSYTNYLLERASRRYARRSARRPARRSSPRSRAQTMNCAMRPATCCII